MKEENKTIAIGLVLAALVLVGWAVASVSEKHDVASKTSESAVVTNDNGSVSRVFTESNVSTNGNMVTEHRRETRTTTDAEGNMLASSTSEYATSYSVGDVTGSSLINNAKHEEEAPAANVDSFLGLKFGEPLEGTNWVSDAAEPTLLRATFKPEKSLEGFDDYYVYVTPTTHQVAKIYACAKAAIEPQARYRRHYLLEALEKRYQTWARLCSYSRPIYTFDIGFNRHVTACLLGASRDYETEIIAWDEAVLMTAADETEAIREAARKSAAEKRQMRVKQAAETF